MVVRMASMQDEAAVAAVLATAFAEDPVWGWAVPAPARAEFWAFWARNGIARDLVWVLDDVEAIAVWPGPGVVEVDVDGELELERLCDDLLGSGAGLVMDILEILESAHPTEPHHYLSLLGTSADHRGRGVGMALVADHLRHIDAAGEAAYLESTNPANLERYARVGFRPRDELLLPGGQVVTTMWRDPQS